MGPGARRAGKAGGTGQVCSGKIRHQHSGGSGCATEGTSWGSGEHRLGAGCWDASLAASGTTFYARSVLSGAATRIPWHQRSSSGIPRSRPTAGSSLGAL